MKEPRPHIQPVPARAGDLVRSVSAGPFHCSESRHYEPLPLHAHERPTITILLDGSYEETIGGRRLAGAVSAALIRPAGAAHADRFGRAGAVNLVIEVDLPSASALHDHRALFDDVRQLRGPAIDALARRMRAELRTRDRLAPLALEGLSLELFATVGRQEARVERAGAAWLDRVRELLEARFAESGLRVSALAREADVHPVHLARAFRERYGVSPTEFIRRRRLEWAAQAVRSGEDSLASIAIAAGFADQSHFSRAFRRAFHMTPRRYRRNHDVD